MYEQKNKHIYVKKQVIWTLKKYNAWYYRCSRNNPNKTDKFSLQGGKENLPGPTYDLHFFTILAGVSIAIRQGIPCMFAEVKICVGICFTPFKYIGLGLTFIKSVE